MLCDQHGNQKFFSRPAAGEQQDLRMTHSDTLPTFDCLCFCLWPVAKCFSLPSSMHLKNHLNVSPRASFNSCSSFLEMPFNFSPSHQASDERHADTQLPVPVPVSSSGPASSFSPCFPTPLNHHKARREHAGACITQLIRSVMNKKRVNLHSWSIVPGICSLLSPSCYHSPRFASLVFVLVSHQINAWNNSHTSKMMVDGEISMSAESSRRRERPTP